MHNFKLISLFYMRYEDFVQRLTNVHLNNFVCSEEDFKNRHDGKINVTSVCDKIKHLVKIDELLKGGYKTFYGVRKRHIYKTQEEFIEECKKIHGETYDLSKTIYNGYDSKIIVGCKIHGDFQIVADAFLHGKGCKQCGYKKIGEKLTKKQEDFISQCKKVHKNKYDLSKVIYTGAFNDIIVICPKHGEFKITAKDFIDGKGCSKCKTSKLEDEIVELLNENSIDFKYRFKHPVLNGQEFDIFIPSKNIAIECQGIQHFKPVDYFGGEEKYLYQKKMDKLKYELSIQNGIKLIYFSNLKIEYPYEVFENTKDILKIIKGDN